MSRTAAKTTAHVITTTRMDETRSHTTVVVGIIIIVIGLGSTTGTVAGDVEVGHDEELYHDDASNFAVINELLLVEGSSITAIS